MSKPIEEHLADFLIDQSDPRLLDYRRRCLAHWREHYGEAVVERAKELAKRRWPKPSKGSAG